MSITYKSHLLQSVQRKIHDFWCELFGLSLIYKNFTFSSKPSYRLDDIGKSEVGTFKIEYEGTLNDLYENHLEKFIEYNIHDVRIVKKLDDKLDFIDVRRDLSCRSCTI